MVAKKDTEIEPEPKDDTAEIQNQIDNRRGIPSNRTIYFRRIILNQPRDYRVRTLNIRRSSNIEFLAKSSETRLVYIGKRDTPIFIIGRKSFLRLYIPTLYNGTLQINAFEYQPSYSYIDIDWKNFTLVDQ